MIRSVSEESYPFLKKTSEFEWMGRRVVFFMNTHLSPFGQRILTSGLKRLRYALFAKAPQGEPIFSFPDVGDNHKGPCRVCLTHDVDWETCQQAVPWVFSIEKSFGLKSTFNFLTQWHYKTDMSLVETLLANDFEIGLHGASHDIAMGARPASVLRDVLETARERLGVRAL